MTDRFTNPDLADAATRQAAELCPLPQGRERGDGTPEGVYQAAFERGARFGHGFPRLADPRLRGVWSELDECLRHERDGTTVHVPVEDLRTLRDALRDTFTRPEDHTS